MRRTTIPLVLLAALSFFAGLGHGAITDADEAFYAESAREMVASGDWLTPHYNFEPRYQKPALYYWLTAATYLAIGTTEFAARLWSALAGVGLVLVTAACARRWCDEDVGLLAGSIVATSFGYFSMARMALPDLPLAFFVTGAIYATLVATLGDERRPRQWLLIGAASAALGFLTKGPIAVLVPAIVVMPVLLIERRSFNVRLADGVLAALLFLVIAVPWYLAMTLQHGTAYLEGFFIGDNVERFATTRFNDPRPWWFYVPILAGGLMPWTPLMVVWLGPLSRLVTRPRDVSIHTVDLRLLLWAILPFVFFTLSIGKQPRYILPVLPPVAILLAESIIDRTRHWRSLDGARVRRRLNRGLAIGALLGGLSLCALAVLLYRARDLFIGVGPERTTAVALVVLIAGAIAAIAGITSAWRAAPAVLAVASAITFAVLPYGVVPAAAQSTVQAVATAVEQARNSEQPVGTFRVFVRNLVFYARVKQSDLINEELVQRFGGDNRGALLVLLKEDADQLVQQHGIRLEPLGEFQYFDDGAMKLRTLIWPDPTEDLRRVLLVRVW